MPKPLKRGGIRPKGAAQATAPQNLNAKFRQEQAVTLRLAGMRYDAIAKQIGLTTTMGAYLSVKRAMVEVSKRTDAIGTQLRDLEVARLDQLQLAIWAMALGRREVGKRGEPGYQEARAPDLKAVGQVLRIIRLRAEITGLLAEPEDRTNAAMESLYDLVKASYAAGRSAAPEPSGMLIENPPQAETTGVDALPSLAQLHGLEK